MKTPFLSKRLRLPTSTSTSKGKKDDEDEDEEDATAAALAEALEDIKQLKQQLASVQEQLQSATSHAPPPSPNDQGEGRIETLESPSFETSRPERGEPTFNFSLDDSIVDAVAGPKSIMKKKSKYGGGVAVKDILEGSMREHESLVGFDSPKQLAIRASTVRFVAETEAARVSTIGGNTATTTKDTNLDEAQLEPSDTVGGMIEGVVGRTLVGRSVMRGTSILGRGLSYFTSPASSSPDFGSKSVTASLQWANMRKNANTYLHSHTRPRVDEYSHYVAQGKLGRMAETWLVPIVPSSTEALVVLVFLFSMIQTVPFGVTRIVEGRYVHQFVQQRIVNSILGVFGISPPFGGDINGLVYGTDEENPDRPGIDAAFAAHLIFGLLWLMFGSFQVILTNYTSRRFHRRLGYVSVTFYFLHALGALNILWTDIVHHHPLVKIILFQDLASSFFYITAGIISVMEGDLETHRDMMVRGYFTAIEGSGTIRFTTWVIWAVGKAFLGPELRTHYCKMACQSLSPTASAAACVVPYIFGLQTMRILSLYWNVLYLRTPEKAQDVTARLRLSEEFHALWIFFLRTIFAIFAIYKLEHLVDLKGFRELTSQGSTLQLVAMTFYTIMVANMRFREVKSTLLMPRRDALSKSTVKDLETIQKWAATRGLNDSAKKDHAKSA